MERKYSMNEIISKVGGRYNLTTIVQKRMRELNEGAPRLVELPTDNPLDVIYEEIMQEKITLVESLPVPVGAEEAPTGKGAKETKEDLLDKKIAAEMRKVKKTS
ncbi:MAG: DNA-directed RNA polymerase subunit omega [Planctomycetota bacterium]